MFKIDSNKNKIIPWYIDRNSSVVEFKDNFIEFSIRLVFDRENIEKINNLKIEVLGALPSLEETPQQKNKTSNDNILNVLKVPKKARFNKINNSIKDSLFSKNINISELKSLNKKFMYLIDINKRLSDSERNLSSFSGIKDLTNRSTEFQGIITDNKFKKPVPNDSSKLYYDLQFKLKQKDLSNSTVLYLYIGELDKKELVQSSTFQASYLTFDIFGFDLENVFIFNKPIVKHTINKMQNLVYFEVINKDKKASSISILKKVSNKNEPLKQQGYEIIQTEPISFGIPKIFKFPYGNSETTYRFFLSNENSISSVFQEVALENSLDNNEFIAYIENSGESIKISLDNISESITSFICSRKQLYPKSNSEPYKFIIKKTSNISKIEYQDSFDLLDGYVYEYCLRPTHISGVLNSKDKILVSEFNNIKTEKIVKTTISNENHNILNNSKTLKSKFDIKIDSKNLKNIASDIKFNNVNNIDLTGNVITGSSGFNSKTDIFDPRLKKILLTHEFENNFTYEVDVLNKRTGKITNLGKKFGNEFDEDIDLEKIDPVGDFQYIIKTKSRHKSIFDDSNYKFFHPNVTRFGTITTKEVSDIKISTEDYLIGELHDISKIDISGQLYEDTISNISATQINNNIIFKWNIDKENRNIETFEILASKNGREVLIDSIGVYPDKLDYIYIFRVPNYYFGEYGFILNIKLYNNTNKKISFNNITV